MTEKYPEHEKLSKVSDKSRVIGEFVDWLSDEKGIQLGHNQWFDDCVERQFVPVGGRIQALLAEFFEIDEDRLEQEKRAMLEHMRNLNS